MTDLFLLSEAQMRRIEPFFPLSHGIPRVDDRRVISGIVFVIRNGLRWRDAPREYGPHKTVYNRFVRWSRLGVFNKIFAELARKAGKPRRLMIDATYITIDTIAKTVKELIWTTTDTYPAQITDDAVTWYSRKHNMSGTYNRQTRQLSNWMSFNGYTHAFDPVPCARAPAAPF